MIFKKTIFCLNLENGHRNNVKCAKIAIFIVAHSKPSIILYYIAKKVSLFFRTCIKFSLSRDSDTSERLIYTSEMNKILIE